MKTEELNITDFTRVDIQHATEVEIVKSDTYVVTLNMENISLDGVKAIKEGDKLIIKRGRNIKNIILAPIARVKARITMPEILELSLSGASHGTMQGFSSNRDLTLKLQGASYLDMYGITAGGVKIILSGASRLGGELTAEDTELNLSGASSVKLKGSARDILIDASGASRAELYDLQVRNANAKLSGASHAQLLMNGRLDVKLSGASKLSHRGPTTLGDVSVTGASTLSSD